MRDGSVLSVECTNHLRAERYVPAIDKWLSAGATPIDLVDSDSIEIGPALLLCDGRVFAVGATGRTALYTAPKGADEGQWNVGPPFPSDPKQPGKLLQAKDAPGCLLPNGRVLCVADPAASSGEDYPVGTSCFEFDPDTNALKPAIPPPNNFGAPYDGRMLLLPTGEVLFAGFSKSGESEIHVYSPKQAKAELTAALQPILDACPAVVDRGSTYLLRGRQFNGVSQAVSYGDDATMATNYPRVRLTDSNGVVWYCRTFNYNTMGVATGSMQCTTNILIRTDISPGPAELVAVANGIASEPKKVLLR